MKEYVFQFLIGVRQFASLNLGETEAQALAGLLNLPWPVTAGSVSDGNVTATIAVQEEQIAFRDVG